MLINILVLSIFVRQLVKVLENEYEQCEIDTLSPVNNFINAIDLTNYIYCQMATLTNCDN